MKSYTDINQSKKLAEILPFESADYHYTAQGETAYVYPYVLSSDAIEQYENIKYIPCWSLAALLNVLPKEIVYDKHIVFLEFHVWENSLEYINGSDYTLYVTESYNNPVDACVDMIIKLHEQKLL